MRGGLYPGCDGGLSLLQPPPRPPAPALLHVARVPALLSAPAPRAAPPEAVQTSLHSQRGHGGLRHQVQLGLLQPLHRQAGGYPDRAGGETILYLGFVHYSDFLSSFYSKCEEDRKDDRQTDLMDSSDADAVSKSFPFHDDKKTVGYKINRKTEKSLAKDEADTKKVSWKCVI